MDGFGSAMKIKGETSLVAHQYAQLMAKRFWLMGGACVAQLISFLLDVATGPALLSVNQVLTSIFGQSQDVSSQIIVWSIRLPVALTALAVGASLGLSGGLMQTILNNPLASSYTLGISAGAGFGAALAIVVGFSLPFAESYAVAANAMLFAVISCVAVYYLGGIKNSTPETLVLAGIAILFLFQALTSLLQLIASPESLQQVVFWLFGSLQKSNWSKLAGIALSLAICLPFIWKDVWQLTSLKLGDVKAQALGINVKWLRIKIFVLISILTGVAVAFVGTIGFIGLVAPHIARMLLGEDQRTFLPACAIFGALLLSLASVMSKVVSPGAVFPIGIMTSLVGVPFFMFMIKSHKRSYW